MTSIATTKAHLIALALLFLMFICSLMPRWNDITHARTSIYFHGRWWNQEVPMHVLDTVEAYREVPFRQHLFLPVLSPLPAPIPTVDASDHRVIAYLGFFMTSADRIIYLSFPPGGFVFADAMFYLADAHPSLLGIKIISLGLQLLTLGLLFALCCKLAALIGADGAGKGLFPNCCRHRSRFHQSRCQPQLLRPGRTCH